MVHLKVRTELLRNKHATSFVLAGLDVNNR